MPLHGKVVVIKRSGADGTEFPLTATCLFGRKPDCDIRIQLPQVSKEHCRIDLNENKEIILTNLSSANPTRVNGEALQQPERLKHGDVITIIDRSFRFEYPPAPTPKKRSSTGGKTETLKVLQDQQVGDAVTTETGEKRISEVSSDPHLKDGTNNDNIQRSLEKTVEVESKEDDSLLQSKTASPFSDLYQMIKKSLDVKTPRKSSASVLQTPTSRFCTPNPGSIRKNYGKPVISAEDKSTPQKDEAKVSPGADESKGAENTSDRTPKSAKKQRRSSQIPFTETARPEVEEAENAAKPEATSPQKRIRTPPQRFTACEVTPKSPLRRRSKEAKPPVTKKQEEQALTSPNREIQKARNSDTSLVEDEKAKETSKKRKSGELPDDLPTSQMKKKRVSFGGYLCPELFDKRLPPDSPLRKGATPRRSFSVSKPKQSLLRRASVIGLLQECEQDHPDSLNVQSPAKMRTPKKSSVKNASPKTPTPGKKLPKSRSPSPKATSPGKKSPNSRSPSSKATSPEKKSPKSKSPSPKAKSPAKTSPKSRSPSPKAKSPAKTSPKSRSPSPKAASPAKRSPKSKSPSPARGRSPAVGGTPGVQTPKVQGRFSVSRISTPSPTAEDAVTDQVPVVTVTPKIPQKRKSISQETLSMVKSAAKVMRRRSDISRASLKVKNSWADIVRFGQPKAQVAAPAKKEVTKKTKKKTVSKPQTPARIFKGHVSTGHADSPVTIVVGRAHKQKVVHPTGAAPRLVTNTALLKKNMKMDEDLTGISEMFKTPVNERKKKSVINENSALKTPVGGLGMSVVEPSLLNTPEEPGEMMVSPLSVSSTVKDRRYNSEAVQRLLNDDQESSFVSDTPALEIHSDDPSEQQSTDLKTASVTTPKQKPQLPECLTGVKRIMKTPRQKAEPVEDLRGKILKTPKQKAQQPECLTGVKRIMKTPRQKAEPIEDLRGKILKTPKQKPEQQECLTGVKRIMKTPRQKAEPVEDLRGKILKTPKQKLEQQECLTGVKKMMETPRQEAEPVEHIRVEPLSTPKQKPEQQECPAGDFKTPQQEAEPLEDLQGKLLETPKVLEAGDASLDDVEQIVETSAHMQQSEDLFEMADMKTPNVKSSPLVCVTGIKRIMKTPKEISAPVEDLVGVKRLMNTPREKGKPVEENFGIKRLVKTPRPSSNEPVEDFEGLQELMEEPLAEPTGQLEANEIEDGTPPGYDEDVAKELDFAFEKPREDVPSDVIDTVPQDDTGKEAEANHAVVDGHLEEMPSGHDNNESSDAMETLSQAAEDEMMSVEQSKVGTADENVSEDQPEVGTADDNVSEDQPEVGTADDNVSEDQPEVGTADDNVSEDQPEVGTADDNVSEDQPEVGTADDNVSEDQPEVDTADDNVSEDQPEVGTADDNVSEDQPEVGTADDNVSEDQPEVDTADENVSEDQPEVETATGKVTEIDTTVTDPDHEKKSDQGRRAKTIEPKSADDKQELPEHSEDAVVPARVRGRRGKKTEATAAPAVETVPQAPVSESLPEVEIATGRVTEMDAAVVQKKSVRGRKAKLVESKSAEDNQETAEHTEDPVVPDPVRGRRGKKTEAAAPPAVRQTRGRKATSQESRDVDFTMEKSASLPSKVPPKPKRGRKASDDQAETFQEIATETEMVPEPENEQSPPVDVDHEANDSAAALEKAVLKPKRGRKTKQPVQPVPEQQDVPCTHSDDVPQADMAKEADATEICSDQLEVVPSGSDENKSSDAMEAVPQMPVTESSLQVETAICKVTEMDAAVVQKKSVRGRRAKLVESKSAEDKQEAAECSEDPVIPATVRGRRGKKTEATAPPAVRQTRGRNAKSQESTSNDQPEVVPEKAVETTQVTEISTEAMNDQASPIKENDSAPPAEVAVVKSIKGRKTKQTPVEPPPVESEEKEVVGEESLTADSQPQKSIPTIGKPRRGRKTKPDTVEQNEVAEDTAVTVETKQPSPPPVRAKRGRNAKQEEEKVESTSVETTKSQNLAKKIRRTRKAEQDHVEPREEVQAIEMVVPEEAEAPLVAEPVKMNEQAAVAAKPRRGGRKAKQDTESETPVESTEVPAVSPADKMKRGRRRKQVTEEVAVTAVVPEDKPDNELEAEEKNDAEPDAPVIKQSRARGLKTSLKNEVSQAIPAKRARRGAALPLEETTEQPTVLVSEPVLTSVEPAKRGRRAAAKPTADDAMVTSDQANPSEHLSNAVVEDNKTTKRSIKWKEDLEVFEIPEVTPVKAVRGRKSKLGGRVNTESKNVAKDVDKTEEKDLSDKGVDVQPVKRARRGAKVADVTADEAESTSKVKSVEAETQPKTRRGRSAKK